jgi:hypothetical protein
MQTPVTYSCAVAVSSTNPDTNAPETTVAESVHAALAAALVHAANEVHGVAGAQYLVSCAVTVTQACSQVMASRNRDITLRLQAPGHPAAWVTLRAPQVCKMLQLLAPADAVIALDYSDTELAVQVAQ